MKLGGKKHENLMELAYDVEDLGYTLCRAADDGSVLEMLAAFNLLVDALREFGEAVTPVAIKELCG